MRWMLWIGYALFGMMMFLVFTYLNFPYPRVKALLVAEFQSRVPAQLSIAALRADPPLGMVGRNVVVTAPLNGDNMELFRADRIGLRFAPLSWIRGRGSMRIHIQAYGGAIYAMTGIYQFLNPIDRPIEIEIQGIDPGRNTALRKSIANELTGLLDGELKVQPRSGGLLKFQMGGRLMAKNVKIDGIKNLNPNPGRLTFSKIECIVAFSDGILHLAPMRAQGSELEGKLEGTLRLRENLRESVLNMRGNILIKPVLASKLGLIMTFLRKYRNTRGEIPFALTGTLQRPSLRVAGMKF
ncbi:MAG: type II secretion system protein GspN [Deltaproteobacteria bacterium]|nr:type II secretion system protein GspN [Deltaproteobacteria bacterium]